ncbi:MAG: hypothetical protein IJU40_04655 [Desulfovibrionaceae bacterium]|nr:hypothetical protein [Desulfovibrionaceae bacterium]
MHEKLGFWNEDYGLYGFEDLEYSERTHLLGLRTGYFPSEGGLRHLGVENSASYQEAKNKYVEAPLSGSKIFFLNKLLFEKKYSPFICHKTLFTQT